MSEEKTLFIAGEEGGFGRNKTGKYYHEQIVDELAELLLSACQWVDDNALNDKIDAALQKYRGAE